MFADAFRIGQKTAVGSRTIIRAMYLTMFSRSFSRTVASSW
jgi:hypothetical protein